MTGLIFDALDFYGRGMMKRCLAGAVALLAGAWVAFSGQPATSQSAVDYSELKSRVEQIERELRTLQRAAAQGRVTTRTGMQAGEPAAGQGSVLAGMEVRLSQLETELQQLTGQIEGLAHRQAAIERQLEQFREDVEFRFQNMDDGTGAEEQPTSPAEEGAAEQVSGETEQALAEPTTQFLPAGTAQEQYDYAFSFLRKGDYQSAQNAFQAFIEAYPEHSLTGNAQYWLGESFYVRQMYPQAAAAFLKGFQQYGDSAKGPDNLLKLGMTLAAMDQTAEACSAFAELDARYPEAPDALKRRVGQESERLGCQ